MSTKLAQNLYSHIIPVRMKTAMPQNGKRKHSNPELIKLARAASMYHVPVRWK